jgi:hypothetical protein
VLLPGFGCGVWLAAGAGRAVVPGVPGCAPAPTAPGGPPLVQLRWFVPEWLIPSRQIRSLAHVWAITLRDTSLIVKPREDRR